MQQPFNIILILCFTTLVILNVLLLMKIWSGAHNLNEPETIDLFEVKFNNYMVKFNKSYTTVEEYTRRFANFKASLAEIDRLNALEKDIVFGLTQFSDMTAQEFASKMLMPRDDRQCTERNVTCDSMYLKKNNKTLPVKSRFSNLTVPEKFDWRIEGYVSPIANQRACYGCWAFSVIGVMETMAAKRNIFREPLSVQELMDCSTYNNRCLGGNVATALEFICYKNLSIYTETLYPLTLKDSSDCLQFFDIPSVTLKDYQYHCDMVDNEDDILRIIANHGPVTAVVNAGPWYNYIGGIIRRACIRNGHGVEHAIQIIGYDKTGAIPYYIVKNSWGNMFGDNGYVKVAIYDNVCGIAEEISEMDVK